MEGVFHSISYIVPLSYSNRLIRAVMVRVSLHGRNRLVSVECLSLSCLHRPCQSCTPAIGAGVRSVVLSVFTMRWHLCGLPERLGRRRVISTGKANSTEEKRNGWTDSMTNPVDLVEVASLEGALGVHSQYPSHHIKTPNAYLVNGVSGKDCRDSREKVF